MKFHHIALCVLLTSCTTLENPSGHEIRIEKIKQLKEGTTNKGDVLNLLGSPSSTSTFGPEVWYYIYNREKERLLMKPRTLEQQVVEITFDSEGMVKKLRAYNLGDSRSVQYSNEVTPTEGNDLSVMEQFLGNIGRFNSEGGSTGRGPIRK